MDKIIESDPKDLCDTELYSHATSACYSELLANCEASQAWVEMCVEDVCSAAFAGDPDPLEIADGYCDNQKELEESHEERKDDPQNKEEAKNGPTTVTTTTTTAIEDAPGWTNGNGKGNEGGRTCQDYVDEGWCKDGKLVVAARGLIGTEGNRLKCQKLDCGARYKYPTLNCGQCGRDEFAACVWPRTNFIQNSVNFITWLTVRSLSNCQVACQANSECFGWTYLAGDGRCLLRRSTEGKRDGYRDLISGPKFCTPPSLDCAGAPAVSTDNHESKCVIAATLEQCQDFASNAPGGPLSVEVGLLGPGFPKFCFTSFIGAVMHVRWNNNTGDGDAAPDAQGNAMAGDTSARRICCGEWLLPVYPAPSPAPKLAPPTPEPTPDRPPLRPVDPTDPPVHVQRPPNAVCDVCTLFGDPHVFTFDSMGGDISSKASRAKLYKKNFNFYAYGNYWLVKSPAVWVQGHYQSTLTQKPGKAGLTKVAVGGPFLLGNSIMIEGTAGGMQVWWNDHLVLTNPLPTSVEKMSGALVARRMQKTRERIEVRFPSDVNVTVMAYPSRDRTNIRTFLTVYIKTYQITGQDGHCGNFNLDFSDDNKESFKRRGVNRPVSADQVLIPY